VKIKQIIKSIRYNAMFVLFFLYWVFSVFLFIGGVLTDLFMAVAFFFVMAIMTALVIITAFNFVIYVMRWK
jgi:hypothetical protein